jgi:cbb3-type cytochrome oxidase maturation protein
MEILILLIPMSVVLALLAAGVFLLMNRQGQFDDLDSPGYSVIADDDRPAQAAPETPPV